MFKVLLLVFSFSVFAAPPESIQGYLNYQLIKSTPDHDAEGSVYLLKSDPCVYIEIFKKNKTQRFCQIGDSGINLNVDHPSAYIIDLTNDGHTIYFNVAAPWDEQYCEISVSTLEISCKPTGKN